MILRNPPAGTECAFCGSYDGHVIGCYEGHQAALAALDRYRYAVAWAGADAWDGGLEIQRRFAWASANDVRGPLNDNEVAEIGKTFHDGPSPEVKK